MKKIVLMAVMALAGAVSFAGNVDDAVARRNMFKEFTLNQGQIYRISVKKGDGVTTVTFPSAISKIAGVNVSTDGKGDFQIVATPGSYYFNLLALKEGATGTLTVVYNRNTYILYLEQSDSEAYSAVNFISGGGSKTLSVNGSGVTPARLMSLIDMAKAYDLMLERYPNDLRDSSRHSAGKRFRYDRFTIELLEVIRFNREDSLVFKLLLHNETGEEILYDKFSFSAQLNGRTYYMSAADASGVMPPKSSTWAFFTITGTPEGGRNNFSPENDFLIGLTAQHMAGEEVAEAPEPTEPAVEVVPPEEEPIEVVSTEPAEPAGRHLTASLQTNGITDSEVLAAVAEIINRIATERGGQ